MYHIDLEKLKTLIDIYSDEDIVGLLTNGEKQSLFDGQARSTYLNINYILTTYDNSICPIEFKLHFNQMKENEFISINVSYT